MKNRFYPLILLLAAGCPDGETSIPVEELDRLLEEETAIAAGEVVSRIEGEPEPAPEEDERPRARRTKVVKQARRLRDKEFQQNYIRNGYSEVAFGYQIIKEILTFTGPTQDYRKPQLRPLDIEEVHTEALHMVQRRPPQERKAIFQDLEIFLVFKAAYDSLSQEARLEMIRDWQEKHGVQPPPAPEGGNAYPLSWLRENKVFWKRGGRFWWWAQSALRKDGGFGIDDKGRVFFTPPHGRRTFTS